MPEFWVGIGAILPELGGRRTGPSGADMEAGRECEGRECVVAGGGIYIYIYNEIGLINKTLKKIFILL